MMLEIKKTKKSGEDLFILHMSEFLTLKMSKSELIRFYCDMGIAEAAGNTEKLAELDDFIKGLAVNILDADADNVQYLIRKSGKETLADALWYVNEKALYKTIYRNMSSRAAKDIEEEIALRTTPSRYNTIEEITDRCRNAFIRLLNNIAS
jgi:hypothetical protein